MHVGQGRTGHGDHKSVDGHVAELGHGGLTMREVRDELGHGLGGGRQHDPDEKQRTKHHVEVLLRAATPRVVLVGTQPSGAQDSTGDPCRQERNTRVHGVQCHGIGGRKPEDHQPDHRESQGGPHIDAKAAYFDRNALLRTHVCNLSTFSASECGHSGGTSWPVSRILWSACADR